MIVFLLKKGRELEVIIALPEETLSPSAVATHTMRLGC